MIKLSKITKLDKNNLSIISDFSLSIPDRLGFYSINSNHDTDETIVSILSLADTEFSGDFFINNQSIFNLKNYYIAENFLSNRQFYQNYTCLNRLLHGKNILDKAACLAALKKYNLQHLIKRKIKTLSKFEFLKLELCNANLKQTPIIGINSLCVKNLTETEYKEIEKELVDYSNKVGLVICSKECHFTAAKAINIDTPQKTDEPKTAENLNLQEFKCGRISYIKKLFKSELPHIIFPLAFLILILTWVFSYPSSIDNLGYKLYEDPPTNFHNWPKNDEKFAETFAYNIASNADSSEFFHLNQQVFSFSDDYSQEQIEDAISGIEIYPTAYMEFIPGSSTLNNYYGDLYSKGLLDNIDLSNVLIDGQKYCKGPTGNTLSYVYPIYTNFVTYIDENHFPSDLELVAGKLPTEPNEILITDYKLQAYKKFGFVYYENGNSNVIYPTKYEDVLNKQMYDSQYRTALQNLRIVGVAKLKNSNYKKTYDLLDEYMSANHISLSTNESEYIKDNNAFANNAFFNNPDNFPLNIYDKLIEYTKETFFSSANSIYVSPNFSLNNTVYLAENNADADDETNKSFDFYSHFKNKFSFSKYYCFRLYSSNNVDKLTHYFISSVTPSEVTANTADKSLNIYPDYFSIDSALLPPESHNANLLILEMLEKDIYPQASYPIFTQENDPVALWHEKASTLSGRTIRLIFFSLPFRIICLAIFVIGVVALDVVFAKRNKKEERLGYKPTDRIYFRLASYLIGLIVSFGIAALVNYLSVQSFLYTGTYYDASGNIAGTISNIGFNYLFSYVLKQQLITFAILSVSLLAIMTIINLLSLKLTTIRKIPIPSA